MSFPYGTGSDLWQPLYGGSMLTERHTYEALERYYRGRQPLSYVSPEVIRATQGRLRTLVVNWPRLVIDSLEERLDVEGFRLAKDAPADDGLWDVWQANRLDVGSQQCHLEALLHGRCYVLVWADDSDPATPRITVESSAFMSVEWNATGTQITQAVKQWIDDEIAYATVYTPDTISRFTADAVKVSVGWPWTGADIANTSTAWELREEPISHDLGQTPVVAFVNRPSLTQPFGETELADVIPVADAINKLATDMMTSAEYHAMPRRWATGVELGDEGSIDATAEKVQARWTQAIAGRFLLSDSDKAKMGQFPEATLENFIQAIQLLTSEIAAMAGLPPQHLGLNPQGNPASADAIRSAEATLVKRVQRKQRTFGESWEDVMRLAIKVRDGVMLQGADRMETMWRDPNTPTIAQKVDAAVKLAGIDLPFRQNLEDLGYTPTQIDRINTMAVSDVVARSDAQLMAADAIVVKHGLSRAAALSIVGLQDAAAIEAKVEPRQPALEAELGGPELGPAPPVAAPQQNGQTPPV